MIMTSRKGETVNKRHRRRQTQCSFPRDNRLIPFQRKGNLREL